MLNSQFSNGAWYKFNIHCIYGNVAGRGEVGGGRLGVKKCGRWEIGGKKMWEVGD